MIEKAQVQNIARSCGRGCVMAAYIRDLSDTQLSPIVDGVFIDTAEWEKVLRLAFPCKNLDCDNGKINHFIWRCLECGREYEGLFPNFTPVCQCGARDAEYLRNDEVACSACNGTGIDEKKLDEFLKGGG